ncbi:MAG: DUF4097 domain-containing protein [Dorea sp.]|nr:DUF4097 domain-containing protein [Dorea sp.]
MRRGWKIFWIVCGAMAVTGFVCCAIAWGMGVTTGMLNDRFPYGIGWVEADGPTAAAEDIHESFEGVKEIDMELAAGKVIFVEGSGDSVHVDTDNLSKKLGFKCYMDDGELKMTSKKRLHTLNGIKGTITVTLPKDRMFEEVWLGIGAGSMEMEAVNATELYVGVGAGEVIISSFQADEAEFDCGAGTIEARGEVKNSADLKCGVGSIVYTAFGEEKEYNYEIECGIGEVICGSHSYSGLGREQSFDNGADKEISVEGGIGSVTINFEDRTLH